MRDTLRALPHTLKDVNAPDGTILHVIATGPGGGAWTCTHTRWPLRHHAHRDPEARLELDAYTTWRLCTHNITAEQAAERAHVTGDQSLTSTALNIIPIIR